MEKTAQELRTSERLRLHIPVRLSRQADNHADQSFFISSLTELSRDGAFVSTSVPYQPGAVVALEFSLPQAHKAGEQNLHLLGRVTRIAPESKDAVPANRRDATLEGRMGVGVRFVILTQEEQTLIEDFIASQRPRAESHNRPTPLA